MLALYKTIHIEISISTSSQFPKMANTDKWFIWVGRGDTDKKMGDWLRKMISLFQLTQANFKFVHSVHITPD